MITILGLCLLLLILGGGVYLYFKIEELDRKIAQKQGSPDEKNDKS